MEELTEFFVIPGVQSSGVGRELFRRTFPDDGGFHRSIIATLDERALTRYLKAGMVGRFPIKYFERQPRPDVIDTDLEIERLELTHEAVDAIDRIDRELLGHERQEDHRWLLSDRDGFVYRRGGGIVGYGYVGESSGPFAVLERKDIPAVLSHAESYACGKWDRFGVEVPLVNRSATQHLLARGFKMDAFTAIFMSDKDFGDFGRYIFFGPPFMM